MEQGKQHPSSNVLLKAKELYKHISKTDNEL